MKEKGLEMLKKKNLLLKIKDTLISHCDCCLVRKQHRNLFANTITRKSGVFELVHIDVCELMEANHLFVLFILSHSLMMSLRSCWLMQKKHKSDMFDILKKISNYG